MNQPTTHTLWQLLDAKWVDTDPDCNVIALIVSAGTAEKTYAVCVSGHKGMKSNEIISALRVAAAGLIRTAGGDMSVVSCGSMEDAKFDTGNQRAN